MNARRGRHRRRRRVLMARGPVASLARRASAACRCRSSIWTFATSWTRC